MLQVLLVPSFRGVLEMVLWDIWDPHVFVLAEKNQTFVYVYSPVNIWSPCVSFLGAFKRPFSAHPVGLQNGTLTCQVKLWLVWATLLSVYLVTCMKLKPSWSWILSLLHRSHTGEIHWLPCEFVNILPHVHFINRFWGGLWIAVGEWRVWKSDTSYSCWVIVFTPSEFIELSSQFLQQINTN
jgi:hypothetical protein